MDSIDSFLGMEPYGISPFEKNLLIMSRLNSLTSHHKDNCAEYASIFKNLSATSHATKLEEVPFIPVRLFKYFNLKSIDDSSVFKILKSSGTTSQIPSKIILNKEVAENQRRVLSKLMQSFTGKERLPMLIIDSRSVLNDSKSFSARAAGVLGFSIFGKDITYALKDSMELDYKAVTNFLEKYKNNKFLLFGFTSVVWEKFIIELRGSNLSYDMSKGILIHGGGWKKLADQKISNFVFKKELKDIIFLDKVHNYYGMIEQTGSIFFECEKGYMHSSLFSDVIIRDDDLNPVSPGKIGLIQLLSLLPSSYPGHSILSEDLGEIIGMDDCLCGRRGTHFIVHGRVENAEIRGCSDAKS